MCALQTSLQTTQYRLARHYLGKLRTADAAFRRGHPSVSYGLTLFDQEWEQIRRWQSEAVKRGNDALWAQLCKEFPLAGLEILANRNNMADQAAWLTAALQAAQELRDGEAERTLCHQLMLIHLRLGESEKVEQFATRLLKLGEAAHDFFAIERAFFGFGLVAADRGMFAEAEAHYQRALDLALELGSDTETEQALNGLGSIATYLGEYDKAYPYFARQLEIAEASGKKSEVCLALLRMSDVLLGLKDYTHAEACLQRTVALGRTFGFQRLLGISQLYLGSSALEQNHLEAARSYLEAGLRVMRGVGVVRQIMSGLDMLGDTLLRMGNPRLALVHLQEGLQMARNSDAAAISVICNAIWQPRILR